MESSELLSVGRRAQEVYSALCRKACLRYGINQSCIDVLLFIANHPEYNTACDLCRIRGIKSGIVSVSIEMLIYHGMLRREIDPRDRRMVRLLLTEGAQPVVEAGRSAQRDFFAILTEGISELEMKQLMQLNLRINSNLVKYLDAGKHSESAVSRRRERKNETAKDGRNGST